jgi:chlorobactene glucosyltransferase
VAVSGAQLLVVFVAFALLVMGLTAVLNALTFPRLKPARPHSALPFVSLLIPARNEAAVIGQTVRTLLAQDYPYFELLILDDLSEDGTAAAVRAAAQGDSRLRLLPAACSPSLSPGAPAGSAAAGGLPAGWLGKNWAGHRLAQQASGDLLIFTDADVQWRPGALAALVTAVQQQQADLLTVWPTQETLTWSERLVVPLVALSIFSYLPAVGVHYLPWPAFAAANGQCLAFRRAAYERVGGHAAVAGSIIEDIALGRRIKQAGLRLRMYDGAGLIACRMYDSWTAVRHGFAKNILAGHGSSLLFLAASTLFHWLVFVMPWVWLLQTRALWALLLVGAGLAIRGLTAVATRQRLLDSLFMPLSVLLMTIIAGQAVWWRGRGGPVWKGRQATA